MAIKQVNAVQAMEEFAQGKIVPASLNEMQGAWLALADTAEGRVLVCAYKGENKAAALFAKKASGNVNGLTVDVMELNPNNAAVVRRSPLFKMGCAAGTKWQGYQRGLQRLAGRCRCLCRTAV